MKIEFSHTCHTAKEHKGHRVSDNWKIEPKRADALIATMEKLTDKFFKKNNGKKDVCTLGLIGFLFEHMEFDNEQEIAFVSTIMGMEIGREGAADDYESHMKDMATQVASLVGGELQEIKMEGMVGTKLESAD